MLVSAGLDLAKPMDFALTDCREKVKKPLPQVCTLAAVAWSATLLSMLPHTRHECGEFCSCSALHIGSRVFNAVGRGPVHVSALATLSMHGSRPWQWRSCVSVPVLRIFIIFAAVSGHCLAYPRFLLLGGRGQGASPAQAEWSMGSPRGSLGGKTDPHGRTAATCGWALHTQPREHVIAVVNVNGVRCFG